MKRINSVVCGVSEGELRGLARTASEACAGTQRGGVMSQDSERVTITAAEYRRLVRISDAAAYSLGVLTSPPKKMPAADAQDRMRTVANKLDGAFRS